MLLLVHEVRLDGGCNDIADSRSTVCLVGSSEADHTLEALRYTLCETDSVGELSRQGSVK